MQIHVRFHKTDVVVWGNRQHGHPKKLRVINKAPIVNNSCRNVVFLHDGIDLYSLFYDDKRFNGCGPKY